jgi:hypothetical protein
VVLAQERIEAAAGGFRAAHGFYQRKRALLNSVATIWREPRTIREAANHAGFRRQIETVDCRANRRVERSVIRNDEACGPVDGKGGC